MLWTRFARIGQVRFDSARRLPEAGLAPPPIITPHALLPDGSDVAGSHLTSPPGLQLSSSRTTIIRTGVLFYRSVERVNTYFIQGEAAAGQECLRSVECPMDGSS